MTGTFRTRRRGRRLAALLADNYIIASPRLAGGRPVIAGTRVPAAMVAQTALNQGLAAAAALHDLTVPQVLAACWFQGRHRGWPQLRSWATRYEALMASDRWGQVPDPSIPIIVGPR